MKNKKVILAIILFIFSTNILISFSMDSNNILRHSSKLTLSSSSVSIQSDPYLPNQWGLTLTGAIKAHALGETGVNASDPGDPVVVAVLDSGVANHTDLSDNFKYAIDFTGEGTGDVNRHGTHVAGIIAAKMNTAGTRGVAPGAVIHSYKVIGASGSGSLYDLRDALIDIYTNHRPSLGGTVGVDVVTMSLGVIPSDWALAGAALRNQVIAAVDNCLAVGIILVAATGNYNASGRDGINYPAALPGVIAVGSIGPYEILTSYSEFGAEIDFVAPGGTPNSQILSTWPAANGSYGYMMGTSQATPHLTGIIAVLLGKNATNNNTVIQDLRNLVRKEYGAPGWDMFYGYGFPQLYAEDNFFTLFIVIWIITAIAGVVAIVIIPRRKE